MTTVRSEAKVPARYRTAAYHPPRTKEKRVGVAAHLLTRQIEHAVAAARFAVDGVTDDELAWEPAPRCWSVTIDGTGRRRLDFVFGQDPPPVTTIEWRLAHLGIWTIAYYDWIFDDATMRGEDVDIPADASRMVSWLRNAQDRFVAATAALDDSRLDVDRPTQWDGLLPVWQLVWAIIAEHFHHGAEIGVLRDLRRGVARAGAWPELHDRTRLMAWKSHGT
jgi:DinB superfamily